MLDVERPALQGLVHLAVLAPTASPARNQTLRRNGRHSGCRPSK